MEKFSLDATAREQLRAAQAADSGRSATTLVGGHERILRQTVVAMTAGTTQSEHETAAGEATVLVRSGRVRLDADGHVWEGRDGDLLVMPVGAHTMEALEDSVFLLTVAMR
ncbi:LuxR family transcriptional regulator [Streptomyces purpureus]|uniref:LuxR family transcriptional regulator n=1 Tax=Streptomyces purpureus TaxID=1951 RepID=UPI00048F2586|nr:LuxR family transcriptional regulator [Streptomyces purpureus]